MTSQAIRQKIARLQAGGRPRVLDLFSGCGGLLGHEVMTMPRPGVATSFDAVDFPDSICRD